MRKTVEQKRLKKNILLSPDRKSTDNLFISLYCSTFSNFYMSVCYLYNMQLKIYLKKEAQILLFSWGNGAFMSDTERTHVWRHQPLPLWIRREPLNISPQKASSEDCLLVAWGDRQGPLGEHSMAHCHKGNSQKYLWASHSPEYHRTHPGKCCARWVVLKEGWFWLPW